MLLRLSLSPYIVIILSQIVHLGIPQAYIFTLLVTAGCVSARLFLSVSCVPLPNA